MAHIEERNKKGTTKRAKTKNKKHAERKPNKKRIGNVLQEPQETTE